MSSNERRGQLVLKIREIARDLSGVSLETITADASFLELGFDSLFLTQLSSACQKAFGVRITFRQLFSDLKSVSALGAYLDEKLPADHVVSAAAVSRQEPETQAHSVQAQTSIPAPQTAGIPLAPPQLPPPVAKAIPVAAVAPLSAPVTVEPVASVVPGMEGVLLQQLELMAAQLRFLRGLPADAAMTTSMAQATTVSHVEATASAPTSVAVSEQTLASEASAADGSKLVEEQSKGSQSPQTVTIPSGFGPSGITSAGSQPFPPPQQRHLEKLIRHYSQRTAGSKERTQRYRSHLADPRTAAGFNPLWKEIVYPLWVQRSLGSKLWDVDGNEFIDLLN